MRISFKVLILLLSMTGCSKSQSAADSDTDSVEIHTVINFVLTDTSMRWKVQTKILSEFTLLPPTRNHNQSYLSYLSDNLSEPDTICILHQMEGGKQFTIRGMAKYGFIVVDLRELMDRATSKGDFWERYHQQYKDGYVSVSKPIFNCARTKVFISVGYHCEGKCGYGTEIVLERVKGNWIIKKESPSWIADGRHTTMNCGKNQAKKYFSFQPPIVYEGGRKEKY